MLPAWCCLLAPRQGVWVHACVARFARPCAREPQTLDSGCLARSPGQVCWDVRLHTAAGARVGLPPLTMQVVQQLCVPRYTTARAHPAQLSPDCTCGLLHCAHLVVWSWVGTRTVVVLGGECLRPSRQSLVVCMGWWRVFRNRGPQQEFDTWRRQWISGRCAWAQRLVWWDVRLRAAAGGARGVSPRSLCK